MRRTRDERVGGTGLPWCRVRESGDETYRMRCDSCDQKVDGPFLEVPADGHTSGVACLPCVQEALDEFKGSGKSC